MGETKNNLNTDVEPMLKRYDPSGIIFHQFRLLKVNYLFPYGKSNHSTFVTHATRFLNRWLWDQKIGMCTHH